MTCTTRCKFFYKAVSQVFGILVYDSIFIRVNVSYFTAFILLELLLTEVDLSRKPIPPPPLWLKLDASVSLPRPPPWHD